MCGNTSFPHACHGGQTAGPNVRGSVNVQICQHQCGTDCPNHRTAQVGSADPLELADRLEQIANVGLVWELHDEDALRAAARAIRELLAELHAESKDLRAAQSILADRDYERDELRARADHAEALADRLRGALRDIANNYDHMDDGRHVGFKTSEPHPRFCAPCRARAALSDPIEQEGVKP